MKTSYKLYPMCDRPRILDTHEEAMAAAKAMRDSNRGFFLYSVTVEDNKKKMAFVTGWNPRV